MDCCAGAMISLCCRCWSTLGWMCCVQPCATVAEGLSEPPPTVWASGTATQHLMEMPVLIWPHLSEFSVSQSGISAIVLKPWVPPSLF